jgi:UDPglucose 6-dehydrogenase
MNVKRRAVIVGGGYVGLVTAVGLAQLGHRVALVETDPDRLASLREGRAPIHEPGLDEALGAALASGQIAVAATVEPPADVALICVGTPIAADGTSDLSQLRSALESVARALPGIPLVIRSTLPPGGTRVAAAWWGGPTARLFTNPEFLRQGTAIADFMAPSRIVVGRFEDADEEALAMVVGLYDGMPGTVQVVDPTAAELIKNGANAFLAMKLSFVNEIAALAEAYGTDVAPVLAGITIDPRIGSAYTRPSFGFGGSCLPKELRALEAAGRARGLELHVASAAADANASQQARFADRIGRTLDGLADRRLAVLGLAFKADTDDIRESPAVALAARLIEGGATVVGHDPRAADRARAAVPGLLVAASPREAAQDADAVVIATEWPEYRGIDWRAVAAAMRGRIVFDGRRLLDPVAVRAAGLRYEAIGSAPDEARAGHPGTTETMVATAGAAD